jgi:predicted nucleic acid-binding protein
MRIDCFLDTNILVYVASGKKGEEEKRARAADLVGSTHFGISTQVLQELYTALVRKIEFPLTPARAKQWIDELDRQPCAVVDKSLINVAVDISSRYRINYWDGAILAAAERLGTEIIYTEDLNHGQSYGPVRVINPFV